LLQHSFLESKAALQEQLKEVRAELRQARTPSPSPPPTAAGGK
jgi:hypothetical protein